MSTYTYTCLISDYSDILILHADEMQLFIQSTSQRCFHNTTNAQPTRWARTPVVNGILWFWRLPVSKSPQNVILVHSQWRRQKFSLGVVAQGIWGRKSLNEVQGRSLGRGSGDEVLQKLKQFADTVYRLIGTAETVIIRNCGINWHPDSWPNCFLAPHDPMPDAATFPSMPSRLSHWTSFFSKQLF